MAAIVAARLQAQVPAVTISGRVVDGEARNGLPFLTLQLRATKDSAFVSGRLSTESGAFTFTGIKPGMYVLTTRAMGYQPIRQRVLVGELSAFLDLGLVTMRRETQTLNGVVVRADADGVAAALDRRTFTVADNASQAGGSVLQAMSTVPGVTVGQDGTVQVRGSDRVAVLIDGKQTALTGFGSQTRARQPSGVGGRTHRDHHQSVRAFRRQRERRHHQPCAEEAGATGLQRHGGFHGWRGRTLGEKGKPADHPSTVPRDPEILTTRYTGARSQCAGNSLCPIGATMAPSPRPITA